MKEKNIEKISDMLLNFDKDNLALVAGIDEVGRGPLAGPVVCACVCMNLNDEVIYGINDSKKLTEKKREKLFFEIINKSKYYCVASVDNFIIDEINILNATKICMMLSFYGLNSAFQLAENSFSKIVENNLLNFVNFEKGKEGYILSIYKNKIKFYEKEFKDYKEIFNNLDSVFIDNIYKNVSTLLIDAVRLDKVDIE